MNENEGDFYKRAFSRLSRDIYLVPEPSLLRFRLAIGRCGGENGGGNWGCKRTSFKSRIRNVIKNFLKYTVFWTG